MHCARSTRAIVAGQAGQDGFRLVEAQDIDQLSLEAELLEPNTSSGGLHQ